MKKNFIQLAGAAVSLAGAVFSSTACAQYYLGGGVGQDHSALPSLSTRISGNAVTVSGADSNKTTWKAYGGYQFTPHWGLEGGFTSLGTGHRVNLKFGALAGSGNYNLGSWQLAGTGTLPLDGGFSVFGKLGFARNRFGGGNACVTGFCAALGTADRTNVLWGVGAQFAITKAWALRLEYEDYGVFDKDIYGALGSGALKASAWNLSAKYSF
jgi:OOP family OmpA-OmpF porin